MPLQILISAGEASSDMYAARLAQALARRTGAHFFGMGGPRMAEAGVELIAHSEEVAVVGITEALHDLELLRRREDLLVHRLRAQGRSPPCAAPSV